MKKRYLSILIIVLILAVVIIYFLTLPISFITSSNLTESQIQKNRSPFRFPFIFPWQTEEVTTTGGGGGSEEGGGGGEETPYVPSKINYTLNIESFPSELTVLTNYSVNNIILNIENTTPYSVEIESNTIACVLLTQVSISGTIRWELDGKDCEPSMCLGFIGCSILMDKPHTAVVYYTPAT